MSSKKKLVIIEVDGQYHLYLQHHTEERLGVFKSIFEVSHYLNNDVDKAVSILSRRRELTLTLPPIGSDSTQVKGILDGECVVEDKFSVSENAQRVVAALLTSNFPRLGRPYWFIDFTPGKDVSIKQGVITEQMLDDLQRGKPANFFLTWEDAHEALCKVEDVLKK